MSTCSSFGMGNSYDRDPNAASHPSPYVNYLQKFTPRRLKELFKWCEYLFYNSPHIYAALRKFGEYPITTITYNTPNKALRLKHEYLLDKVLKARERLIEATLDKYVYGNSFTTMYQPFMRYLQCPKCRSLTNIRSLSYKFNVQKLTFSYKCMSCNSAVTAGKDSIKDKKLMLSRKVNFIRWDPKLMDIDYNEITGESEFYYTIPQEMIYKVNSGHKMLIDTMPLGFLEAIQANKKFKFAPDTIYHMSIKGPAGINPQWGLPPLLAVMSRFHYTEVLRKANEAIALDHLLPLRLIHPSQATSSSDPMVQASLSKWMDNMKNHMKAWRKDPLHIGMVPFPLNSTQIGGQGRALLTLGEVQEAEKSIVASLGIPMEFLYGGLTGSGMEATLRLIENQLETHIQDLLDFLQWIDDKCSKFLGWESVPVSMTKFRIVDDQNAKSIVFQLWQSAQQGGPALVSNDTIADMYDIDINKEKAKIRQEKLDAARDDMELQAEIEALQNSMKAQVQQEMQQQAAGGQAGPLGYNPQQVMAEADGIVEQMMQMDEASRKGQLHQLQTEDAVMYAVVIQRLEQQRVNAKREATAGM